MANSKTRMTTDDAARALGDEYQVFLSFRGPDTRHGFIDFLYHDLVDAGVRVFRDEDELHVGEVIGENLLRAINSSRFYVPIFSRTYASSKWCLRELAHIVDNVSKSNVEKSILPIFFDVEPEDIKLKTPLYNDAFLEHEKRFLDEVQAWKKALAQVDEIKGWNMKKDQRGYNVVL
ncbi:toll/interleukin-1 receptor-like protein [Eucalyptus grandis]|uniref:toll/interleukin-1 receptor-like protein n=1 Tax=Eucalyptus grandis TaxID=71139 RepID=UPI00192EAE18|nr:toll/interleukin-1 receptor-like protein [Eucalyptus grandis]